MSALPTPPLAAPESSADPPDSSSASDSADETPSAHQAALRQRAVALFCQGLRSPAISEQLGIPERTVRAWLAQTRQDFAAESAISAQERLATAVERQLSIAAAAWASYHHAVLLEQLALDHHRACAQQAADPHHASAAPPPPPPKPSIASARFLSVALAAQREAARMSGCYDRPAPARPAVTTEVIYDSRPALSPSGLHPADEAAWDDFVSRVGLKPWQFSGPYDLDRGFRPTWEAFRREYRKNPPRPASSAPRSNAPVAPPPSNASTTPIPAKTATASPPSPPESAPATSRIPAKTATAAAPASASAGARVSAHVPAGLTAAFAPPNPSHKPRFPAKTASASDDLLPRGEAGQGARPAHSSAGGTSIESPRPWQRIL